MGFLSFFLKTEEVVSHSERDIEGDFETPVSNCSTNINIVISNDSNNITGNKRNTEGGKKTNKKKPLSSLNMSRPATASTTESLGDRIQ